MLFDDTYKTIAIHSEGIFSDRGSKFIAYAYPLNSEEQVKLLLSTIRSNHSKARHFCWAMRISQDRTNFRLQDDGEPSGTAGRPILNNILSADITNVIVIVVRYFGGTLLGVPGLINAYKSASLDAISNSEIVTKTINDVYEIKFDYLVMNDVMRIVKDHQTEVVSQTFDNSCCIQLSIRKSLLNIVLEKLEKNEELNFKYLYTV
jgi:uncharacterized YigZ family protein